MGLRVFPCESAVRAVDVISVDDARLVDGAEFSQRRLRRLLRPALLLLRFTESVDQDVNLGSSPASEVCVVTCHLGRVESDDMSPVRVRNSLSHRTRGHSQLRSRAPLSVGWHTGAVAVPGSAAPALLVLGLVSAVAVDVWVEEDTVDLKPVVATFAVHRADDPVGLETGGEK